MAYIVYHNPRKMEWGVGHHLKNIWTSYTLAEEFGLTPLQVNIPGPWAPWTDFLNYNDGLETIPDRPLKEIEIVKVGYGGSGYEGYKEIIEPYKDEEDVIFKTLDNTRFLLSQMSSNEKRNKVINHIRETYWKKRITNYISDGLDHDKINVAVHIRRGDIQPNHPGVRGRMWIDDQYFLNVMREINKLGNVKFRIYSNFGVDFNSITNTELDVELVLGLNREPEKEFGIFHQMLCSDILIASPSNFSYLLGEMSNIVVLKLERIIPYVFEGTNIDYTLLPYSSNVRCIETQEDGGFDFKKLVDYMR